MKILQTNHGVMTFPTFLPDATFGSIRTASFDDVRKTGISEIVTTTLHIEQKIGSSFIEKYGGLHKFFSWDRPILTDSGGWQVFSLINSDRANPKNKISEVGCSFIDPDSGSYSLLTPESSITIQNKLGADILTVLDNPIKGDASLAERKKSVEMNTRWARRAKEKFVSLGVGPPRSPVVGHPTVESTILEGNFVGSLEVRKYLGAVVQGADDFELRRQSAEELIEIGFDLYNFGGIPLHSGITWKNDEKKGEFYREMLQYVAELLPDDKIKYAMGVGQPDDIAFCVEAGWDMFDTVLPTRNARHGYIYVSEGQGDVQKGYKSHRYDVLHLKSERYKHDEKPLDENCDCEACSHFSRAYLRHLIRIGEPAGMRLCTIHNLAFYSRWMTRFRGNEL